MFASIQVLLRKAIVQGSTNSTEAVAVATHRGRCFQRSSPLLSPLFVEPLCSSNPSSFVSFGQSQVKVLLEAVAMQKEAEAQMEEPTRMKTPKDLATDRNEWKEQTKKDVLAVMSECAERLSQSVLASFEMLWHSVTIYDKCFAALPTNDISKDVSNSFLGCKPLKGLPKQRWTTWWLCVLPMRLADAGHPCKSGGYEARLAGSSAWSDPC